MKRNKKTQRILVLFTAVLLVTAYPLTAFAAAPATEAAAVLPVINTKLNDANYINQEWMNHRLHMKGYGINCSLGIGEMKDYPVCIHAVNNITICELKDKTLLDAFEANINNDLKTLVTPVNAPVFSQGTTQVTVVGSSYRQLNDAGRNWILGYLQQALMGTPGELTLNLEEQYLTTVYTTESVALSPDYILSGSCTTSYKTSSKNRSGNIEVAASYLNNMVIMPGQSVSVSEAIRPRTTAFGYKTAHAYLNGEIVDALGGGICQVSSTVYNACRNSGLTIVERHSHSMPVSYLPLGQDAAISSGTKDMIFQNPYSMPIVMQAVTQNKHLTVNFLIPSGVLNGVTFKFWSKKTGGLSATTYLTTYINGEEAATTVVDSSRYNALPQSEE